MNLHSFADWKIVVPDLAFNGIDDSGTCPVCNKKTFHIRRYGTTSGEAVCEHCSKGVLERVATRIFEVSQLQESHPAPNGARPAKAPRMDPPEATFSEPPIEARRRPKFITMADLMKIEFPPIRWAVPRMVGEGVTILAGGPKSGKSWLALMFGMAVGAAGRVLGSAPVEGGEVLYLALEDSDRRIQERHLLLDPEAPGSDRVVLSFEWPTFDQGGVQEIEAWLESHKAARLIIVDVLALVRPNRKNGADQYDEDYALLGRLKRVARDYGVSILLLTHTRKMIAPDPYDMIRGSVAMAGAPDGLMVLMRQRDEPEATLHFIGRDVGGVALHLHWNEERTIWEEKGNADEYELSEVRQRIRKLLGQFPDPLSPQDVAEVLGISRGAAKITLMRMVQDGQCVRKERGRYTLSDYDRTALGDGLQM